MLKLGIVDHNLEKSGDVDGRLLLMEIAGFLLQTEGFGVSCQLSLWAAAAKELNVGM